MRASRAARALELYVGPMWSGKTNALLQRVDAARCHYDRAVVVKHAVDTRVPGAVVVARTGLSLPADVVLSTLDDLPLERGVVYAVDEAQFFGDSLLRFYKRLRAAAADGAGGGGESRLLVAGLDLDFRRQPFGACLQLAADALAHGHGSLTIRRMTARCAHEHADGRPCGRDAPFTQRLAVGAHSEHRVLVGGAEAYRPACPRHHVPHPVRVEAWRGTAPPAAVATA